MVLLVWREGLLRWKGWGGVGWAGVGRGRGVADEKAENNILIPSVHKSIKYHNFFVWLFCCCFLSTLFFFFFKCLPSPCDLPTFKCLCALVGLLFPYANL